MKSKYLSITMIITGLIFALNAPAFAANECNIKYGWNTGSSLNGTFKNHSKTLSFNKGQTRTINKKRLNYVKNKKNRKVRFYLKDATNVTLSKNQRNPITGTYIQSVKLVKVKCLNNSTTAANAGPASPQALIQMLKNQRTPVKEIARQLSSSFNKSKIQVVQLLKTAGYSSTQIAPALKSGMNASAKQTTSALKSVMKLSRLKSKQALQKANYQANQILAALNKYYGQVKQNVGKVVKYTASPKNASRHMAKVCSLAGYSSTQGKACARAISKMCNRANINPKTKKCWQWVLASDKNRTLNISDLRR